MNRMATNWEEIKKRLAEVIKGKVVILGVGNDLRGDDGFGSLLAKGLKEKVKGVIFDGGKSPENYIGKIIKERPDSILIVDALDTGSSPGEVTIREPEELRGEEFSTHHLSLPLMASVLQSETRAKIHVIGVQPVRIKFGEGLSLPMERVLERLRKTLIEILAEV